MLKNITNGFQRGNLCCPTNICLWLPQRPGDMLVVAANLCPSVYVPYEKGKKFALKQSKLITIGIFGVFSINLALLPIADKFSKRPGISYLNSNSY